MGRWSKKDKFEKAFAECLESNDALVEQSFDEYMRSEFIREREEMKQRGIKGFVTVINGWVAWYCPECEELVAWEDFGTSVEFVYCPYCGKKIV